MRTLTRGFVGSLVVLATSSWFCRQPHGFVGSLVVVLNGPSS